LTKIVGICSGKGGVGKTTIATNLALAIKKFGHNVIIIDCNLSTPHLSYYLGVSQHDGTINDVLLEKKDITEVLTRYHNILYVPASLNMDDLIGTDPMKLKKFLTKLTKTEMIDYIILDSAPGLGREALSVLDAADELVFVATPFIPMINDVIRCKTTAEELKGTKNLSIVLNMVTGMKHEVLGSNIERVSGMPVIGEIPFDKNVIYSLVSRVPVINYKPSSLASIGIMQLAARLTKNEYKPPTKLKIHNLFARIKNSVLAEKIRTPKPIEQVRGNIFLR